MTASPGFPAQITLLVDGQKRRTLTFDGSTDRAVVLGHGAGCDLEVPDGTVARRHCMIFRHGACWFVADVGPNHGTWLDARLLEGPAQLRVGSEIRMGTKTVSVVSLSNTALGQTPVRIDMAGGWALWDEKANLHLPLDQFAWFAFLAEQRSTSEGWVNVGPAGLPTLRLFVLRAMGECPWGRGTGPLVPIAQGAPPDHAFLKELRARTADGLMKCIDEHRLEGAARFIPEWRSETECRIPAEPHTFRVVWP